MADLCGIVAEYNPFHNGHAGQIDRLRREFGVGAVVAVMSGNFTQRGEAAILDKRLRAALAVDNGVDLAVELPVAFALRSAQDFARGGIKLLAALGVDSVAFGAECAELPLLRRIAAAIDDAAVQDEVRRKIKGGASYAVALTAALKEICGADENILHEPNNILAIEYLRVLKNFPHITPLLLQRKGAAHNDDTVNPAAYVAGGAAIREAAKRGAFSDMAAVLPPDTLAALKKQAADGFADVERVRRVLLYKFRTATPEELREIFGINEGLEHKFLRGAFADAAGIVDAVSGKRYPKSRIRRTLLHILLRFTKAAAAKFDAAGAQYVYPLAFNECGQGILRRLKTACPLPIIQRPHKFLRTARPGDTAAQMLALDVLAADLYALCAAKLSAQ